MKKISILLFSLFAVCMINKTIHAQVIFSEDFENNGLSAWTQEYVFGTKSWNIREGDQRYLPAYSGTNNAFFGGYVNIATTKLVTPQLNWSGLTVPVLQFWHIQAEGYGGQDVLKVYYKTSTAETWTLLETYSNNITDWTQETIALPNTSDDYYIAFEGTARYGYGIALDDVKVCDLANYIDAKVEAIVTSDAKCIAPIQVAAMLKNYGGVPITSMTVYYQLNNLAPINQVYNGNLAALSTESFLFTTPINIETLGEYTLKVWTSLSGDEDATNDTLVKRFSIYFSGGNGSYSFPYEIRTAEELSNVRNFLESSNKNLQFRIMNDIDLSTFNNGIWRPIGSLNNIFNATLHGGGHTITGLNVTDSSFDEYSYNQSAGLFGAIDYPALIDNLQIHGNIDENVSIATGLLTGFNGYNYSYGMGGVIEQCIAVGKVKGNDKVGGIVGSNTGTIENCYAHITMIASRGSAIGGLTGENYGIINNSYAVAAFVGENGSKGAVTGYNQAPRLISNCYYDNTFYPNGIGLNNGAQDNVIGRSTIFMYKKQGFADWDFTKIWKIQENNSYPYFQWQSNPRTITYTYVNSITGGGTGTLEKIEVYKNNLLVNGVLSAQESSWSYSFDDSLHVNDTLSMFFYESGKSASYPVLFVVSKIAASVSSITLDQHELAVTVGVSKLVQAIVDPTEASNKTVIWTSRDETIAKVNHGVVSGQTAGVTYIIATTQDGALQDSCEVTVIPRWETAAQPENIKTTMKIYPNPVTNTLSIEGYAMTDPKCEIYSSAGILVATYVLEKEKTEINIEYMPAGIYFVKIDGQMLKVVKK